MPRNHSEDKDRTIQDVVDIIAGVERRWEELVDYAIEHLKPIQTLEHMSDEEAEPIKFAIFRRLKLWELLVAEEKLRAKK